MGPKDFVTSRDGTQIWTDAVGDHSKPSIVFVNGFISSALVFEKQFEDPELINRLHLVRHSLCSGYFFVLTSTCEGPVRPSRTGIE